MAITHSFPIEIFQLIKMHELSKRHFELHPIWSEHYDFEEREEIISWGVDAEWLDREIKRVHNGNEHCAYPILRPCPLPDRMRLYIRARFVTSGNVRLDGYVMNEDAFVVCLFSNENEYSFSAHPALRDSNDRTLQSLKADAGLFEDSVFPLRYETDFLDRNDEIIAGEFTAGGF